MSARRFITVLTSGLQQVVSAIISSSGAADAFKIIATDATGKISMTLFPAGIEVSVRAIEAQEALVAGDFINLYSDGGTTKARKANAGVNRPAHGFILAGVAAAGVAQVYTIGENTQLSGLVPGTRYFLSEAGGELVALPDVDTVGNIIQGLGFATSPTSLRFEYDEPVLVG